MRHQDPIHCIAALSPTSRPASVVSPSHLSRDLGSAEDKTLPGTYHQPGTFAATLKTDQATMAIFRVGTGFTGSEVPIVRTPGQMHKYNDRYVIAYDFKEVGKWTWAQSWIPDATLRRSSSLKTFTDAETASKEVETLCEDLELAGLHTEVRAGYEKTLLIFVKAPREVLGKFVYQSRYGLMRT